MYFLGISASGETIESSGCFSFGDYGTHFAIYDVVESSFVFNSQTYKWATIITEPERKPLLVSEDGFNLYEGDYFCFANKREGKWYIELFGLDMFKLRGSYDNTFQPFAKPDECKVFKNEDNAIKWVEEANKPKQIEIEYSNGSALVTSGRVSFNGSVTSLNEYQLSEINKAIQSLK